MPINFADLTIIHNDSFITNTLLYFNYEQYSSKDSQMILLFSDDTIINLDNILNKNKISFDGSNSSQNLFFKKKKMDDTYQTYFKKCTTFKNDIEYLNYDELLGKNKIGYTPSIFNCIYYKIDFQIGNIERIKKDVFGIIHKKSSQYKPLYKIAYDSDEFTKEDVAYIINYLFRV